MVGESNQNVFFIQIDALSFAEFQISEFEISRVDCILFSRRDQPLYEALLLGLYLQYPFLLAWVSDNHFVDSGLGSAQHSQTQVTYETL